MSLDVIEIWDEEKLDLLSALMTAQSRTTDWQGRWGTSIDYMRWRFVLNPAGTGKTATLISDGRLLGTCSFIPKRIWIDGSDYAAAEIGDLFVAPELRGQGQFKALVSAIIDVARASGAAFVYCMPNRGGGEALLKSGPFFRLPQGEVRPIVVPLRPSFFVRSPNLRRLIRSTADFGLSAFARWAGRHQRMTQCLATEYPPHTPIPARGSGLRFYGRARDLDYRILSHPERKNYSILKTSDGNNWAIVRDSSYGGALFMLVGDLQVADLRNYGPIVRDLIGWAYRHGFAAISWWAARGEIHRLLAAGVPFVPLPPKECIVLDTPLSRSVRSSNVPARITMMDTDKI